MPAHKRLICIDCQKKLNESYKFLRYFGLPFCIKCYRQRIVDEIQRRRHDIRLTADLVEWLASNYNSKSYPLENYFRKIDSLHEAKDLGELEAEIRDLLFWKFENQNTFLTIHLHEQPKKYDSEFIWSATSEDFLAQAYKFKRNELMYNDFKPIVLRLSTDVELSSFIIHILRPRKWPMLNNAVWKMFRLMQEKTVKLEEMPETWDDYEAYRNFFNTLIEDLQVGWQNLYKAFFFYGETTIKLLDGTYLPYHLLLHFTKCSKHGSF